MSYASKPGLNPSGKAGETFPLSQLTPPSYPPPHTTCTLAQLRPLFVTNSLRRDMWHKMIAFLSLPILSGKFSYLYIDGGFATAKEHPHDIDVVLETREPYGPAAFRAIEPFFAVGLDTILDLFTVHLHFWMENAPPGMIDFRTFFLRTRRTHLHRALAPDKALFRVSLLAPDIRESLRIEMEAATHPESFRKRRSK